MSNILNINELNGGGAQNLLLRRRELMMQSSVGRLPKEYKEVACIRATGSQYFEILNHGINNKPGMRTFCRFKFNSVTREKYIFSSYGNQVGRISIQTGWAIDDIFYIDLLDWGKAGDVLIKERDTNIHSAFIEYDKFIVDGIESTVENPKEYVHSANRIAIFSSFNGEFMSNSSIYEFYVEYDGVKDVWLIPCVRKSDNLAGFYDIPNQTFRYSRTSTPFQYEM